MCHRTLAIYCFIDDFLKARGHVEDCRIEVTDAEIITIARTSMLDFGGNFEKSRLIRHEPGVIKRLLSRSRFSRRLTRVPRKANSKRSREPWQEVHKSWMRKYIETTIGEVEKLFRKKIQATTLNGFLLKIALFLFAFQIEQAFI